MDEDSDSSLRSKYALPRQSSKSSTNGRANRSAADAVSDADESVQKMCLDVELNALLQRKADDQKLTVRNVKTILRHIITNEDVLKMVRDSIQGDDISLEEESDGNSCYTPKLTRAKFKEMMRGSRSTVQKLSVDDLEADAAAALLLKEFGEEGSSSDEEYNPEEVESEADSCTSLSEIGSPSFGTPRTPTVESTRVKLLSNEFSGPRSMKHSPMSMDANACSPCVSTPSRDSVNARKSLEFPVPKEDVISLRTRSRHPMKDTTVESFELSFIPPDITPDMYDTEVDNPDWAEFLRDLVLKPPQAAADPAEDDDGDPEFNVVEAEEPPDPEETANTARMRISKRELNDLLSELFEDDLFDDLRPTLEKGSETKPEESKRAERTFESEFENFAQASEGSDDDESFDPKSKELFSQNQLDLLYDQMARHVHLLTQTWYLCAGSPCLEYVRHACRTSLMDINDLRHEPPVCDGESLPVSKSVPFSFFAVPNLPAAMMEIGEKDSEEVDENVHPDTKFVHNRYPGLKIPISIAKNLLESRALMFPEMLPTRMPLCFGKKPTDPCPCLSNRVLLFSPAEDRLIALGLREFLPIVEKNCPSRFRGGRKKTWIGLRSIAFSRAAALIEKHLMPARNVNQIVVRVKNVSSTRRCSDENPLSVFVRTGILPSVSHPEYLVQRFVESTPLIINPIQNFPIVWQKLVTDAKVHCGLAERKLSPLKSKPSVKLGRKFKSAPSLIPKIDLFAHLPEQTYVVNMMHQEENHSFPEDSSAHMEPEPFPASESNEGQKDNDPEPNNDDVDECAESKILPVHQVSNEFLPAAVQQVILEVNDPTSKSNTPVRKSRTLVSRSKSKEPSTPEEKPVDPLDDLMKASTTVKKPTRKSKKIKETEASLKMLADEDPEVEEQRDDQLVYQFLFKLHETLSQDGKDHVYSQFYKIMLEFDDAAPLVDRIKFFHRVETFLDGYPDLVSEFLTFVGADVAFALDRYEEYSYAQTMREFLRCLEVHFAQQPQHVQKITKAITQLSSGETDLVTKQNVRSIVQPLLRGNPHLLDLFTSLLRCEQPPESMFQEIDFEEVNILGDESNGSSNDDDTGEQKIIQKDDDSNSGGDEEMRLVDEESESFGGSSCPCKCHDDDDPKFKARLRHCVPCGVKYVEGGAYVKVGKTLRPAKVSYIYRPQVNSKSPEDADGSKSPQPTKTSAKKTAKSKQKKGTPPQKPGRKSDTTPRPRGKTTPPDDSRRGTPRRSSLTPGSDGPGSRKRKSLPQTSPGEIQTSIASSSTSDSGVQPKVRKTLHLSGRKNTQNLTKQFATPAKSVEVPKPPGSSGYKLPDFSSMELPGMTPWKTDPLQPITQDDNDMLETPKPDFKS
ncbi:unnamed protein product [Notodromas monacha]|uniref:GON-4-like protein n=1 Tax=Notodromas monacha TaxID=399045 RepID=A0A7R9GAP6_9CRUS|nr:unnamed protein product [Notodromas monacha]CAG0915490.1 unnamed protein product [Notodromas monacha]